MSRYDRYSPQAMEILYAVQDIVRTEGRDESRLSDLSRAILISAIPDLLEIAFSNERSLNREKLKGLCAQLGGPEGKGEGGPEGTPPGEPIRLSGEFRNVLDKAERIAGPESVKPAHIIHAAWGYIKNDLVPYFDPIAPEPGEEPAPGSAPAEEFVLPKLAIEGERAQAAEILKALGRELTSAESDYLVLGRGAEIDSLASILSKYYKPNPLLLGEPGVGKTAIVEGLAMRIKAGLVPARLQGTRIFELRLSDLTAGASAHGALEERLKNVIQAVESSPDIVVFFDEMHTIAQAYGNEPVADILKPALSRGKFRCIGAATIADYHRFLEKDEAFTRRFQTVLVKEPERQAVSDILRGLKPRLEAHYGLSIPDAMLERSIGISAQHLPTRFFPDKALDVLDRGCSKALFRQEPELSERHLREAVTDIANVRFEGDIADESGVDGLEERLKRDIVGQDAALARVCAVLKVCKKHLDLRPERPDGAFLFTGPTGVGKTALAQSIARRLSGRDDALFRIDMSEFSESHTVARLLGAPPGYVGYGDIALLAAAVEKNPSGVLLLDEFEKAHPQVHRLFLQILDSGRATDAYGKTLSFSNMTIIATCNVNDDSGKAIGFQEADPGAAPVLPLGKLKQVFPPELLNRFDALVPFRALLREDCARILDDILIKANNENLMNEYGFRIEYSPEVLQAILDSGFSSEFGARNLQRAFQEGVILPLAQEIESLRGQARGEARCVTARLADGKVAFGPPRSP